MSEPSKLSQQIVAIVLKYVSVKSNAKERRNAAFNVDAFLSEDLDKYGDEEEYHLNAAMLTQLEGERLARRRGRDATSSPLSPSLIPEQELIERLAALAHEQWSGWMRYQFECMLSGGSYGLSNGQMVMPGGAVERWQRQMNTSYADLSENEKESDRNEARRMVEVFRAVTPSTATAAEQDALVDEVQHRMDQVVEAAVEWHQAGREGTEWFDAAEKLGAAIDSLLELRHRPNTAPADAVL